MLIEHVSFAVSDPEAVASWYGKNFGMKVIRRGGGGDVFVTDDSAGVVLQLEDVGRIDDEASRRAFEARGRDMRNLHLAFVCDDVGAAREQILAAGATADGAITVTPGGDEMATIRDPWGLPVQLVKRSTPMF